MALPAYIPFFSSKLARREFSSFARTMDTRTDIQHQGGIKSSHSRYTPHDAAAGKGLKSYEKRARIAENRTHMREYTIYI